jgi:hypothetical protein
MTSPIHHPSRRCFRVVLTYQGRWSGSAGLLVGYEPRLDFVPRYLRVLPATVALMPLAHWGGLLLRRDRARGGPANMVALILGLIAFLTVVTIWTEISPRFLTTPRLELSVMVGLAALSQVLHRRRLLRHFATADLA